MADLPQTSVALNCPHCELKVGLMQALTSGSIVPATWQAAGHDHWWIGVCPSCRNGVLVHEISLPGVQPYTFYPAALLSPTDERIPPEIRRDLEEAKRCFSVQAYRACAVMARRAMQGACIEQGATQEKLVAQLHELAARHVITDSLKPWGDAVRWVGNDAAHPNGEDVAEEDAEDILSLAEQFMPVVYVASAIAKDIETKRHR